MDNSNSMAMQLAQPVDNHNDGYAASDRGSMRGRDRSGSVMGGQQQQRPGTSAANYRDSSSSARGMSLYEGAGPLQPASRTRSKSVAAVDRRSENSGVGFTRDGRVIMHYGELLSPPRLPYFPLGYEYFAWEELDFHERYGRVHEVRMDC